MKGIVMNYLFTTWEGDGNGQERERRGASSRLPAPAGRAGVSRSSPKIGSPGRQGRRAMLGSGRIGEVCQ